ncbi:MAG: hypothetical protein ACYDG6_04625 [Thermincolia bacterium]
MDKETIDLSNHGGAGNWLIAAYRPNSLFSLRMSHSTSSGGKTLFVPTPYSFKLAMVDASFRAGGKELATRVFDLLKGREIRFQPPKHLTVNHTFVKIKREPKEKKPEEPYISSIGFREFCFYQGEMNVSVEVSNLKAYEVKEIIGVMAHINYFGKRGSFFQFLNSRVIEELPEGFIIPEESIGNNFNLRYQVVQFLDDLSEIHSKDLFERINSFSAKSIELGKHRVLKPYFLPYRMVSSSKNYTYYCND